MAGRGREVFCPTTVFNQRKSGQKTEGRNTAWLCAAAWHAKHERSSRQRKTPGAVTSADIARRVSIGSRAVFVFEHVYMSEGKNCPTATGLKSGCVGFRGMASGLAKAHITATEEAAKQGKTMTGTVRHEPGWRGFFYRGRC